MDNAQMNLIHNFNPSSYTLSFKNNNGERIQKMVELANNKKSSLTERK